MMPTNVVGSHFCFLPAKTLDAMVDEDNLHYFDEDRKDILENHTHLIAMKTRVVSQSGGEHRYEQTHRYYTVYCIQSM